jgi:glycosyltransferase involved in cell wall biosynthesis
MTRDLGTASLVTSLPRALRAPLVYESHGYAPEVAAELPGMLTTAKPPSRGRLKRLASREEAVWRQADGYVTITRGLADDLTSRFGPRPHLAVVPDGVRGPVNAWEPPPRWDVVAYAGHLYPWKGVDVLLQALALMPHIRAIIVGGHAAESDRGRLESLAVTLGVASRVEFTGQVAPVEVPPLLRRAAIVALPNTATAASTRFTSPLKLFEYMAAGRAIVASDLPALREVLRHETNALLVPPGDPAALAAAIARLAADPGLSERLARQALADAAEYTWDKRAARLGALFEEVASPR